MNKSNIVATSSVMTRLFEATQHKADFLKNNEIGISCHPQARPCRVDSISGDKYENAKVKVLGQELGLSDLAMVNALLVVSADMETFFTAQ